MLTSASLSAFADVLATNLATALPYHDPHFFVDDDPHDPRQVHPAFGNCYDWHSSVNSSWAVARLHRLQPSEPHTLAAYEVLTRNVTREAIERELAYFRANPHYERPYGWAWFLALYAEADEDLRGSLRPLAAHLVAAATSFIDALISPITHGVHSNTAFAAVLMSDAARSLPASDPCAEDFQTLAETICRRARQWFGELTDWPAHLERSGHDFLSPGLTIAELMSIVLLPEAFPDYLARLLGPLNATDLLLMPADVHGARDPQQVHWHGLNLSRAGQLVRLARLLPASQSLLLRESAERLWAASIAEVTGDNYASTHWLASFALRAAQFSSDDSSV